MPIAVVVLFKASIHWDPAIALAMVRATARVEIPQASTQTLPNRKPSTRPPPGHGCIWDAALAEQVAGRARSTDATHPVHYLVRGYFHGAHGVARR